MRIVVAMSGGVDSSAAAAVLKEQGHEVIGMTLRVWSYESKAQCGSCCSPDDIDDARRVAERLDIPFYVANVEELFKDRVVNPFVQSYLHGQTPIPCVACNQDVKFGFLLKRARALGAKLATGHYAQIAETDGKYELRRGADQSKDQSYFLFTLGQDELKDLIFPVGHLQKAEVRAIAEQAGLITASKPESMEICFVPDGKYAKFVEKIAGPQPKGRIVNQSGETIGEHDGIHHFTIGQRRGLGVAVGEKAYVAELRPEQNEVVVADKAHAQRQRFHLLRPHWTDGVPPLGRTVQVKIRHRHAGALGQVELNPQGVASIRFESPEFAVTPGQAAVCYDGDRCLGGGWII